MELLKTGGRLESMVNYSIIGKNFQNGNRVIPFAVEHIYGTKVMKENNIMVEPVAKEDEEPIEVVTAAMRKREAKALLPRTRKVRSDKGQKRSK